MADDYVRTYFAIFPAVSPAGVTAYRSGPAKRGRMRQTARSLPAAERAETRKRTPLHNAILDTLGMNKQEGEEHTPLHRRVTSTLARHIEQGALPPGTLLPPETELAQRFGVSRHTMRKGLDALVAAGLVQRRRRKGTVVTRPPVQQSLQRFYSIEQEMHLRGARFSTRVLSRGRLDPHDDVAARACAELQVAVADAQQVGSLVRLRLVDGLPLLLEHVLFPAHLCLQLLDEPVPGADDPATWSFYEQLADASGLRVTHARERFRPIAATGYEARLLRISAGAPVFEVERTSFAGDTDHPVEWRLTLARGDQYRFTVDLVNPTDANSG